MKTKNILLPLLLLMFTACTGTNNKQKETHLTHTLKLQKNISINFIRIDAVSFEIKPEFKNLSVEILIVDENKKKELLLQKDVYSSDTLKFSLPENIESYKYLVALIESVDQNGNKISAVDTYKIGEQDQINAAKNKLKD